MIETFPCQKCGCCCKVIGNLIQDSKNKLIAEDHLSDWDKRLLKQLTQFPYLYDSNGKCVQLKDDNTCMVYDKRPIICNVKKMYKKFYREHFSYKQFTNVNIQMCSLMRSKSNG